MLSSNMAILIHAAGLNVMNGGREMKYTYECNLVNIYAICRARTEMDALKEVSSC